MTMKYKPIWPRVCLQAGYCSSTSPVDSDGPAATVAIQLSLHCDHICHSGKVGGRRAMWSGPLGRGTMPPPGGFIPLHKALASQSLFLLHLARDPESTHVQGVHPPGPGLSFPNLKGAALPKGLPPPCLLWYALDSDPLFFSLLPTVLTPPCS